MPSVVQVRRRKKRGKAETEAWEASGNSGATTGNSSFLFVICDVNCLSYSISCIVLRYNNMECILNIFDRFKILEIFNEILYIKYNILYL